MTGTGIARGLRIALIAATALTSLPVAAGDSATTQAPSQQSQHDVLASPVEAVCFDFIGQESPQHAQADATVVAVLFVAAVSVAAAVFLVLELDGPLDGFIKVSSKPMEYVLSQLGH